MATTFDIRASALGNGAQDVAPDAPEAVDGDLNRHDVNLPVKSVSTASRSTGP